MNSNEQSDEKYELFDKQFWIFAAIFISLILLSLTIPWFLNTRFSLLDLTTDKSGHIGDSIGGTLGPAIAIIAAAFTFLAFWVQYKANLQQMDVITKEREINNKQKELDLIMNFQREGVQMLQNIFLTEVNDNDTTLLKCYKGIKKVRQFAPDFTEIPNEQVIDFIEELENVIRFNHSVVEKIDTSTIDEKDKKLLLSQTKLHYSSAFGGSNLVNLMTSLHFACQQNGSSVHEKFVSLDYFLKQFYIPTELIFHKYLDTMNESIAKFLKKIKE